MGRKAANMAKPRKAPPPRPLSEDLDDVPDDAIDAESADRAEPEGDELPEIEASATDNVGEQSVEINVEGLIAEIEAESRRAHPAEIVGARRKLEDLLERKRMANAIEDFDDFEI